MRNGTPLNKCMAKLIFLETGNIFFWLSGTNVFYLALYSPFHVALFLVTALKITMKISIA